MEEAGRDRRDENSGKISSYESLGRRHTVLLAPVMRPLPNALSRPQPADRRGTWPKSDTKNKRKTGSI